MNEPSRICTVRYFDERYNWPWRDCDQPAVVAVKAPGALWESYCARHRPVIRRFRQKAVGESSGAGEPAQE